MKVELICCAIFVLVAYLIQFLYGTVGEAATVVLFVVGAFVIVNHVIKQEAKDKNKRNDDKQDV